MMKIQLSIADNGIIKHISDDNYNGNGYNYESKVVYSTLKDKSFKETIRFFDDLSIDLGINMGNVHENVLNFNVDWGDKYTPTQEEIKERIKMKSKELKFLRSLKDSQNKKVNMDVKFHNS